MKKYFSQFLTLSFFGFLLLTTACHKPVPSSISNPLNWQFRIFDARPVQFINSTDQGVNMYMSFFQAQPPLNMNFEFINSGGGIAANEQPYLGNELIPGSYGYHRKVTTLQFANSDTLRITEQRKFALDVYNGDYDLLDGRTYMPSWEKRAAFVLQSAFDNGIYFVIVKEEKTAFFRTTSGDLIHPVVYDLQNPPDIAVDSNGNAEELDSLGNPVILYHERITVEMIDSIAAIQEKQQNIVLD
ncbi:hypothetical protein IPF86_02830 [Candidatus Nomurabacteria bacterium]|nr:MAG: hypothetical protein IPF86_02830 [Candidatus Nomurabacteria bacterium]